MSDQALKVPNAMQSALQAAPAGAAPYNAVMQLAAATGTMATTVAAPLGSHVAASSAELTALASRRSAAWLEHGRTIATCREPQTLMASSQTFWQQAATDYTETVQRLMASWMKAAQGMQHVQAAAMEKLSAEGAALIQRDILVVAEPKPTTGQDRNGPGPRRAAA